MLEKSLATVVIDTPSVDPPLHITALEGYFEITVSLDTHAMSSKISGESGIMIMIIIITIIIINNRLNSANACYHSVQSISSSSLRCKNVKI
jgi:hypothetical protein